MKGTIPDNSSFEKDRENQKQTGSRTESKWPRKKQTQPVIGESWTIERLDRKLADAIVSNIVEKCDVTLSRAIQPHSTFCASYVSSHISLSLSSTINIGHVLK